MNQTNMKYFTELQSVVGKFVENLSRMKDAEQEIVDTLEDKETLSEAQQEKFDGASANVDALDKAVDALEEASSALDDIYE